MDGRVEDAGSDVGDADNRLTPASDLGQEESKLFKIAFLAGAAFLSLFGGVGFNLLLAGSMRRGPVTNKRGEVLEDPVRLASRAFRWGSLYAICGVGAISYGSWLLLRRWERYTQFHTYHSTEEEQLAAEEKES